MRTRLPALVSLILVFGMVLAACGQPTLTPAPPEPTSAGAPAAAATSAPEPTAAEPTPGIAVPTADPTKGVMTISKEQQSAWVRNFNPLLPDQSQRWPTRAGIYEPLLVFNVMTSEYVPWLASEYEWADGSKKLIMTARENVKWTDGQPFTAKDIAFTFNLMKQFPALDNFSVWTYLVEVTATDDSTIEFVLKQPYTPALFDIAQQPIVPEHIWKDVEDPTTFANENPVATGPFAIVKVFQNQVFQLDRNPNYWQEGKPYIQSLRFPAYNSNEQANLALMAGEVDWAGNFVPDADNTYVAQNPDNKYWFPAVGGSVFLYVNTTKAPFDDPNVRKAISMALDREQIVKVAMYDYIKPADATGMSDNAASWKDPAIVAAGTWVKMDVAKANELLDAAGLKKGADGIRTLPDGTPMRYDLHVVTGWSDWVSTCQIMSQNLKAVGIDAPVKTSEFGAWFDLVTKGNFDLTIGWSTNVPLPYNIYREKFSCETALPIGEQAGQNWQRYCNEQADVLLTKLAASADPAEQKDLVRQLQQIFVDEAPAIPLFPGPSWGEYNTKRFTNWPNADNPYAKLTPNDPPGYILVLTEVKPK